MNVVRFWKVTKIKLKQQNIVRIQTKDGSIFSTLKCK